MTVGIKSECLTHLAFQGQAVVFQDAHQAPGDSEHVLCLHWLTVYLQEVRLCEHMCHRSGRSGQELFHLCAYCCGETGLLSAALTLCLSFEIGHELVLLCQLQAQAL